MTAANYHRFSTEMDKSTDVSDTTQLSVFIRGVHKEINITEELAVSMPIKRFTAGAHARQVVKKVLQNLNITIQKLVTNNVQIKTDRGLVICHCLIHQQNLCVKSFKTMNIVRAISGVVNFI
jgi:hypothetical protein